MLANRVKGGREGVREGGSKAGSKRGRRCTNTEESCPVLSNRVIFEVLIYRQILVKSYLYIVLLNKVV